MRTQHTLILLIVFVAAGAGADEKVFKFRQEALLNGHAELLVGDKERLKLEADRLSSVPQTDCAWIGVFVSGQPNGLYLTCPPSTTADRLKK